MVESFNRCAPAANQISGAAVVKPVRTRSRSSLTCPLNAAALPSANGHRQ